METLSVMVNAAITAVVFTVLGFYMRGRFEQLERRLDRLEVRLDSRIDSVRADLTQVALAVGAKPRAQSGS